MWLSLLLIAVNILSKGFMSEDEIEKLKIEALKTYEAEIIRLKNADEKVECFFVENWNSFDVREFIPLHPIKNVCVAIGRLVSKPKIICVILMTALTFESLHLNPLIEETRVQFNQEYSNIVTWNQQAHQNSTSPLIYEFVEMEKLPPPHVPEREFNAPPQLSLFAQLTGSSAAVSGQYLK
jgi:hypothetical protein